MCLLSPARKLVSRIDVNTYFDSLLTDIYKYQNLGSIFICGDFNARCGELEDFISGVDHIEHRNVIDFKTNFYGEVLIYFFINTNMCILNGRNYTNNGFISVCVKGSSVVDYCLVSHESLPIFSCFEVISTVDLISRLCSISTVAPASFPDHSVIVWKLNLDAYIGTPIDTDDLQSCSKLYDKFDVSRVSEEFLTRPDIIHEVNTAIFALENSLRTQCDVA